MYEEKTCPIVSRSQITCHILFNTHRDLFLSHSLTSNFAILVAHNPTFFKFTLCCYFCGHELMHYNVGRAVQKVV